MKWSSALVAAALLLSGCIAGQENQVAPESQTPVPTPSGNETIPDQAPRSTPASPILPSINASWERLDLQNCQTVQGTWLADRPPQEWYPANTSAEGGDEEAYTLYFFSIWNCESSLLNNATLLENVHFGTLESSIRFTDSNEQYSEADSMLVEAFTNHAGLLEDWRAAGALVHATELSMDSGIWHVSGTTFDLTVTVLGTADGGGIQATEYRAHHQYNATFRVDVTTRPTIEQATQLVGAGHIVLSKGRTADHASLGESPAACFVFDSHVTLTPPAYL